MVRIREIFQMKLNLMMKKFNVWLCWQKTRVELLTFCDPVTVSVNYLSGVCRSTFNFFANELYNPEPQNSKIIVEVDGTYSYIGKSTNELWGNHFAVIKDVTWSNPTFLLFWAILFLTSKALSSQTAKIMMPRCWLIILKMTLMV